MPDSSSEAQRESGEGVTADTAGRDAVSRSSQIANDDESHAGGDSVPAEGETDWDHRGRRGPARGLTPVGEQPSDAHGGLGRPYLGLKMAVPQLQERRVRLFLQAGASQ